MRHLLGVGWREQLLPEDATKEPQGVLPCQGWQLLPEAA
jgi:hypothetical protein